MLAGAACEPRLLVGRRRRDRAVDDSLVAEPRATEQRVVGGQQALIAAAVDLQRGLRDAVVAAPQVGVHVRAAERVDRLLGIGDQHERHAVVLERAVQDLPLDRVGVLELVDQHDLIARAQPRGRRRGPLGPSSVSFSRVSRSS